MGSSAWGGKSKNWSLADAMLVNNAQGESKSCARLFGDELVHVKLGRSLFVATREEVAEASSSLEVRDPRLPPIRLERDFGVTPMKGTPKQVQAPKKTPAPPPPIEGSVATVGEAELPK